MTENLSADYADYTDYNKLKTKELEGKKVECRVVGGAVAEDLFDRGLCLPSGTAMTSSDMDRVISVIRGCCRKSNR